MENQELKNQEEKPKVVKRRQLKPIIKILTFDELPEEHKKRITRNKYITGINYKKNYPLEEFDERMKAYDIEMMKKVSKRLAKTNLQ